MKRSFVILTIILYVLSGLQASAQDTSKQQKKKEALEQEIGALNKKIKDADKKKKAAQTNLNAAKKKVKAGAGLVAESKREVRDIDERIREKQDTIHVMENNLKTMQNHYWRLVRGAYKVRRPQMWYTLVMASTSFEQAGRRYAYMKKITAQLRLKAEEARKVRESLEKEKAELDVLMAEANELKQKREADLKVLKRNQRKSESEVAKITKDKKSLEKELKKKQQQVNALNAEIKKLIAAATKKSSGGGSTSKSSSSSSASGKAVTANYDVKLASDFAANKGSLPWPVSGTVAEHYGQHYHPVYTNVKLPFNYGVTVATKPGATVKAVFTGVVQSIAVMPGYNQCVLVQHGNYYTFYCKLKSVSVKSGDKVTTGQTIGTVDTIGGETQFHFELWKDSNPQNPESWLR